MKPIVAETIRMKRRRKGMAVSPYDVGCADHTPQGNSIHRMPIAKVFGLWLLIFASAKTKEQRPKTKSRVIRG